MEQMKIVTNEIYDFLKSHPMISENAAVNFNEFNSSSLDILVIYFVMTSDGDKFTTIKEEVNYKIMEIVEKNNCSFAFPTTSVYIENNEMLKNNV